jgi:hypothetical protein
MSDAETWEERNAHYLSRALTWLRLRLERLAQRDTVPVPAAQPKQEPPQKHGFLGRSAGEQTAPTPVTPVTTGAMLDERIKQLETELAAAETATNQPPALIALSQRLGLSRFEREILLLCVAMELDTRIAALCAHAQNDTNRPYPTFALALMLFDDPPWEALAPDRPLRYWHLIEINQPGALALTNSPLRADERIVNYVKGLNRLDDRIAALTKQLGLAKDVLDLPPSQQEVVQRVVHYWQQMAAMASTSSFPYVQLVGSDEGSKELVALHTTSQLNRQLYRLPMHMFPVQGTDIDLLARLWQRESLLLPLALYLDAHEMDASAASEGQVQALSRFLAHNGGICFLSLRESLPRLDHAHLVLDVARPTPAEQHEAWITVLKEKAGTIPALLTSHFHLNTITIQRVAQMALADAKDDEHELAERLWDACRLSVRPHLDMLAQRLDSAVTWDDLVLPQEETTILHQVADQVRQRSKVYEEWGFAARMKRGLGINALFAGESGTGKTLAAEVIANDLHLSLYRIDLSAVVSKYIGETEKNLRRLFDGAEDGGALLFFDEADALFGKRSEVKDSHDRYANIEINYLLQRMEAYRGLAILATNMKSALDTAFLRRLRFVIDFPFPGLIERKRMWQKVFPQETPHEQLDYDRLARFNLTGGSIRNSALNAAFLAAQAGTPVSMALIFNAVRTELRKLERPINEADFKLQGVKV